MYEEAQPNNELPQIAGLVEMSVAKAFQTLAARDMVAVTGEFGEEDGNPQAAIAMFRGPHTRHYLEAIEMVNKALGVETVEQVIRDEKTPVSTEN